MPDLAAPDLAALAAAARGLLPGTAAVAATDPTQPAPALWRGEALPNAIDARQREFAAGRHAARQAMEQLGCPAQAIPIGADRAPIWPTGLNGSITHSAALCLAVVTQAPRFIGIDLEPATPLPPDLWDTILLPDECATLARAPDAPLMAKLVFSAKEAAYKAQYARSKTLFGFEVIHITLGATHFTAQFTQDVPGFAAGSTLGGRYTQTQGHFLTVVTA
ncbi:4'-phosphopantetheinyl transferase [Pseudorhodobacter sp. W20_MBD10_FR17]|uniref:4'-phosphopantetheinyl transferase family protein n=1 Tax=Pseudorhodobacter sp. W20_MBD10_FR17 TaxID=3240266 RepID=UPI003F9A9930